MTNRSKGKAVKCLMLFLASALFLASCASGTTTPASTSASETLGKIEDSVDILAKEEGEVGVGGILRLPIAALPSSLSNVLDATGVSLIKNTRSGDFVANDLFLRDFKVTSQNPQIIEYHLVPGNVWSDNTPINYKSAQNVFKINKDPEYRTLALEEWEKVESVKRGDDDYHVIIKIKSGEIVPEFWRFIDVLPDALVATPEIYNEQLWEKQPHVVGGPYKVGKLDRTNGNVILVPNETFRGARKAKFSAIIYQVIADPEAQILAFKNGQVDSIGAGTSNGYSALKEFVKKPGYVLRSGEGDTYYTLVPNGSEGRILSDINLRKAIFYAVDRSKIFSAALGTLPYPKDYAKHLLGNRIISQNKAGYEDHAGEFKEEANIEAAKKSVEKSGWTLGKDGYYQRRQTP